MDVLWRRIAIGTIAGALASVSLLATVGRPFFSVAFGIVIGAMYSASLRPTRGAYVDNLMAAAALGVPLWALVSVTAFPLFSGQMPEWSASQMRQHFPALVGWILYGAALGVISQALNDVVDQVLGPEPVSSSTSAVEKKRIAVVGGGFAGMRVAQCLEEKLGASVSITLISETNALLFTPMLAEVAGSSLEPSHITTPLRSSLHCTRVHPRTGRRNRSCVAAGHSGRRSGGYWRKRPPGPCVRPFGARAWLRRQLPRHA